MKPYHLSSSFCRHYAIVAADSWHHQKPKWLNDMQPAVCQPGWCSVRKGVVADLCVCVLSLFWFAKSLKWCSDKLNFLASIKRICLPFVCLPDWEGHSAEGWAGGDSGEASRSLQTLVHSGQSSWRYVTSCLTYKILVLPVFLNILDAHVRLSDETLNWGPDSLWSLKIPWHFS